jgi:hypothetical protein
MGEHPACSARSQRSRLADRHGGAGARRDRGASAARRLRPAHAGGRAPLGNAAARRARSAPASTRASAAGRCAPGAHRRAAGSPRPVERLRRSEVAAPAGDPRRPQRAGVASRGSAWRDRRRRRPRRALARRGHRPGAERRKARRDRGHRAWAFLRRRPWVARRLSRDGPLSLSRRRRSEGRRGRGRRGNRRPAPRLRHLSRPDRRAAHGGGLRTRRGSSSVGRSGGARRRTRLARLARRSRARPLAGAARGSSGAARLEPVRALRRRIPALVRRSGVYLRRHAPRRPGARGISRVARGRATHRRLDRVWTCDRARDVVPVSPDLARHGAGQRSRSPDCGRGTRLGSSDGGGGTCCAVRRCRDGAAQRLGCRGRRRLRTGVREHPGRPDHIATCGRSPRPGSGRCCRLCLAAWRASAS